MKKSRIYVWNIPVVPVLLKNNEVHIWHVDIEKEVHDLESYRRLLSSDENEQANRYHFKRDRIRHTITHGILRLLISRYLSIELNDIIFNFNKYRKPEVLNICADKKLCFNLSHSDTQIVYAFSWDRKIGIDIEKIRPMKDADDIIKRYFSERERIDYFSIPIEDRTTAFFNCWTRKEAYIKARGDGLYFPLNKFSVTFGSADPPKLVEVKDEPNEKDRWNLHEIVISEEYCGALAIEGNEINLNFFEWAR